VQVVESEDVPLHAPVAGTDPADAANGRARA
jgi:hypothetical protein